jgi:hypothetical protein
LSDAGAGGGVPFNSDLSAVLFFDGQSLSVYGADNIYNILSPLGESAGTAAATRGGNLLAELLSLF